MSKIRHIRGRDSSSGLIRGYIGLARPHQWAKNSLVAVPLIASHKFTVEAAWSTVLAFAAFCLTASSVYVLNDLIDLNADRGHRSKRRRPLASGSVPTSHGFMVGLLLLAGAAAVAAPLGWLTCIVLGVYVAINLAYSLLLKKLVLVDVLTLAGLYTLRVIAGASAINVMVSHWLLVFSMFIFFSLALIKRHSEMVCRIAEGLPGPPNRDYRATDLPILVALAAASGCAAVIVLALYIESPEQRLLYQDPRWLYLVCPLLLYWIARILMLSNRGELPDDPVVFAMKDPISLIVAALFAVLVVTAIGL